MSTETISWEKLVEKQMYILFLDRYNWDSSFVWKELNKVCIFYLKIIIIIVVKNIIYKAKKL